MDQRVHVLPQSQARHDQGDRCQYQRLADLHPRSFRRLAVSLAQRGDPTPQLKLQSISDLRVLGGDVVLLRRII